MKKLLIILMVFLGFVLFYSCASLDTVESKKLSIDKVLTVDCTGPGSEVQARGGYQVKTQYERGEWLALYVEYSGVIQQKVENGYEVKYQLAGRIVDPDNIVVIQGIMLARNEIISQKMDKEDMWIARYTPVPRMAKLGKYDFVVYLYDELAGETMTDIVEFEVIIPVRSAKYIGHLSDIFPNKV